MGEVIDIELKNSVPSPTQLSVVHERFYYLPLTPHCLSGCPFCSDIGCKNDEARTIESVARALKRAASVKIKTVLFTSTIFDYELNFESIQLAHSLGMSVIIQVPVVCQIDFNSLNKKLDSFARLGCCFNFLISNRKALMNASALKMLLAKFTGSYCTLISQRGDSLAECVGQMSESVRDKLYFYFPMKHESRDFNLHCSEIYRELKAVRKIFPSLKIRPPRGIEVWNSRIHPKLGLEPVEAASAVAHSPEPRPEISVIIPSFNNRAYLLNTLRHLLNQTLSPNRFEIVIVDDGSQDDTHHALIELVGAHSGRANLKYIYFPRRSPRTMGDGNFRAGIARNLGVKSSRGELLVFLDSDILTPVEFLENLIVDHKSHDVVQCVRLNLKKEINCSEINYSDVIEARDTSAFEGDYWKTFFAAKRWSDLPFFWKYTCTYGLSMSRQTFESIGWLRRSFVYYGFEDTELGYRLAKEGLRFHLSSSVTYHCFHETERSEFQNLDFKRHRLLSKTAKIFYLNVLDPEVFEHFQFYLHDTFAWASRLFSVCTGVLRSVLGFFIRTKALRHA